MMNSIQVQYNLISFQVVISNGQIGKEYYRFFGTFFTK